MAVLKGMVELAGLSRATQQMVNYAFVTISAFRKYKIGAYTDKNLLQQGLANAESKNEWLDKCPEAQKYLKSFKENMAEHRRLMLAVRRYDIYCYQIIGQYPEGGVSKKEVSLFCFAPKDKAERFKDIMIELGEIFEQDSICYCPGAEIERATDSNGFITESKLKANIVEIATSPREIDAKGVSVGSVVSKFNGVSVGSLVLGELDSNGANLIQDIFSKVSGRPFFCTGYEEVITPDPRIKGYHAISNIAKAIHTKDLRPRVKAYSTGDYEWVKAWIRGDIELTPRQTIHGTSNWRYGNISKLL